MNNEVKSQIQRFSYRADSFLRSSKVLGMVVDPDTGPTHYFLTQILLNTICLELIMKMFWMIENDKKAEHNHNTLEFFENLNDETKIYIQDIFHDDEHRKKGFETLCKARKDAGAGNFPEENLKKILSKCEDVVVKFKYNEKMDISNSDILAPYHLYFLENLLRELNKRADLTLLQRNTHISISVAL